MPPHFLHILPVNNGAMLNRVSQTEGILHPLGLLPKEDIIFAHTRMYTLLFWHTND